MTDVALLLVVVLALAIRRRDSLVRRGGGVIETLVLATSVQRLPYAIRTRFGVRAFHATLALVALAALVIVGSTLELVYVDDLAQGLVFALMLSSLVVITGYTGQLSFGQSAFIAIGAILGGRLLVFNMNWWVALLCVTLAGAAIAGICGIPALRIRGIYLALISLALATAAGSWLFTQNWLIVISPDGSSSLQILRPSIAGFSFNSDRSYYMLLVAAMAVVWSLIWLLRQSRLGRAMFAVRENELQAEAHGISPVIVKLTAFSIGGGIAAFSGFLYGCLLENFPDPSIFAAALSLSLIAFAIVGGIDSLAGVGAAGIMLLEANDWQENPSLELIADANASPPAGIEGVGLSDRGNLSHGKILFGALGFGALKLALHRACVARLFEQNDLLLDAEEIYGIAKGMVGT